MAAIVDTEVERGEGVIRDFGAVDADALVGAREMRRRVQPSAQAGSGQDGSQRRGGRPFAIGAGDQNRAKTLVRIAKRCKQCPDFVE